MKVFEGTSSTSNPSSFSYDSTTYLKGTYSKLSEISYPSGGSKYFKCIVYKFTYKVYIPAYMSVEFDPAGSVIAANTGSGNIIKNNGTVNVYGGSITGGDIGIYNNGVCNISGRSGNPNINAYPEISGNSTADIYLCKGKVIDIGYGGFKSDTPANVLTEAEPTIKSRVNITNANSAEYLTESAFANANSDYEMINNNGVLQLIVNGDYGNPAETHASFVAESNEGGNAEPFAKSHMASGDEIIEQDNTGGINGSTVATVFESTVTGEEEPQYLAWFVSIPTENTYIKSTDGTSGYDNIVLGDTPVVTDSDNVTQGKGSIYSAEGSDEGFNLRYKYTVDSPQTNADNQYVFSLIIDNIYSPYANAQLKVCTAEEYNALTQYEDITNK